MRYDKNRRKLNNKSIVQLKVKTTTGAEYIIDFKNSDNKEVDYKFTGCKGFYFIF